jgi:putative nucleotidyltransferase with HDIG domain
MTSQPLRELVGADIDIPPMPHIATRAFELFADENVTAAQLSSIICRDAALASRVLNMSNSAFYRRAEPISTLRSAIVVLGLRTTRNLVLSASITQLFDVALLFDRLLWEHSVGTALAATVLAGEIRYAQPDEVMLAGLVHDIGKNILNNSMSKAYKTLVVDRVYGTDLSYYQAEMDAFGFSHAHLGPVLSEKWNFPTGLGNIIYYHHHLECVGDLDDNEQRLVALVHLADLFCKRLGIGYRETDETVAILSSPACSILDLELDEDRVAAYANKIGETFSREKGSFQ